MLFWVIWAGLAMATKINGSNLWDSLMFIRMWKIKFTPLFFLTYCKDITNLLHWVLAACLARTSKSDTSCLYKTLTFIMMQKIIFIPNLFLELLPRTATLLFWVLRTCLVTPTKRIKRTFIGFRKNKWQNFPKNTKYPIFGPFLPKFGQKWIFHKNRAPSLFSMSPTSCKKSEKINKPILRKTLN